VLAGYAALAVGLTWPAAIHPVSAAPGSPRTDLWEALWSNWFAARALAGGEIPSRVDGLLNHPVGGTLWLADPLGALGTFPLLSIGVPVAAAWTLLALVHLVFAGAAAHRLGERLGGHGGFAGVAYAGSATMLAHLHNGATEAVGMGWLPLSILAVLRASERPGAARLLAAAVALAVATVAHWYGGVCAFLAAATILARGPGRVRVAAAMALAAAMVLPVALAAREASTAPGNVVGIKSARELATVRRTIGPADPLAFLVPGDYRSPDFRELSRYGEDYVHTPYLGWTALVLGAAAVGRRPRRARARMLAPVVGGGVLAAALACGPVLARNGAPVILAGRLGIPLPYLLVEGLPGFDGLSLVWRLGQLATLAVAVAGARGARRFRGRASLLALVALGETWWISPMAGGAGSIDATLGPEFDALRGAPPGAVMSFPIAGGRAYLYEQTAHQKPVTAGLNFPNNAASKKAWRAAVAHAGGGTDAVRAAVVSVARSEGIRYLVVHDDPDHRQDAHDAAVAALERAFPAIAVAPGIRIYRYY
jgi:hypothetical protein